MTTVLIHDDGAAPCHHCGQRAELRTCVDCYARARVIDCGHKSQPRPIAADIDGESRCEECVGERS